MGRMKRASLYLLLAGLPAIAAAPVRVLILSGHNNHVWRQTTPFLQHVLDVTGRFETRVLDEPAGITGAMLANYDVVVSNYRGPRWNPVAEKALEEFVRQGRGFAAVHGAAYPFGLREGHSWTDDPRAGHGQRRVYEVKWTDREHPVARGLAPSFLTSDEWPNEFKLAPGLRVLAAALAGGRDEPLLWTLLYGKGRVFYTALGHDLDAMGSPGFLSSFARGVEWAATSAVTLPVAV